MFVFMSFIWIISFIDKIIGDKCIDTVGWHDKINNSTCIDYVDRGWCVNNTLISPMTIDSIPSLNFPELNCCACGKKASLDLPSTTRWAQNATTVAGSPDGKSGPSLNMLHSPQHIYIDDNNTLYIVDQLNDRVVSVSLNSTITTAVIGKGSQSSMFSLNSPIGIHVTERSIYITDALNYQVQKWSRNFSNPVTVAGIFGVQGDSTSLTTFSMSYGLFVDNYANIFVSDAYNHRVMMFPWDSTNGTSGVIVAGTGFSGRNTNQLYYPGGIHVDDNRALYIADSENHRIQKWIIGASEGVTVAGISGLPGNNLAQLHAPMSVLVDLNGYIYISDNGNNRIMRWAPGADAGECIAACSDGQGIGANQILNPRFIVFDSIGSLYVSDCGNNRVQKFQILNEIIQNTTQSSIITAIQTLKLTSTTYSKTSLIKSQVFITLVLIFVQIGL